jgi:hypothetical protein
LLPCLDVLITSFPQTWGHDTNEGKNFDLLTDLIEYIRGARAEPLLSAHDLASAIVKRCSNVFTSDAKLLSPHPFLSEIYQEAIGVVVCALSSTALVSIANANKVCKRGNFFQRIQQRFRNSFEII